MKTLNSLITKRIAVKAIMKKFFAATTFLMLFFAAATFAQKPSVGVLNIQSKSVIYDTEQSGNLTRMELEKLELYEVMQKEDIRLLLKTQQYNVDSCFGKICLVNIGKEIGADYMLSGSIERYSEKVIITYRLFDVKKNVEEKAIVEEFLNIQPELQLMVRMTLQKMFEKPVDAMNYARLTKPAALDNKINNPGINKLVLSGPRIGLTYVTGITAKRMMEPEDEGGFGINRPLMTIFGYQHEVQYINEGRFQALLEILPMVSGLDVGRFVPTLTMMNGIRDNKSGWEFAFGPTAGITRLAKGYYDKREGGDGKWHREEEWMESYKNPNKIIEAIDRRGDLDFDFSFVFAVGKTIRSGSMNLPVNAFIVTGKGDDFRIGLTFGFNAKNRNIN